MADIYQITHINYAGSIATLEEIIFFIEPSRWSSLLILEASFPGSMPPTSVNYI